MIDKECLECKRYYSKSCNGVEDRKRKEITIENSCSGLLKTKNKNLQTRKLQKIVNVLLIL